MLFSGLDGHVDDDGTPKDTEKRAWNRQYRQDLLLGIGEFLDGAHVNFLRFYRFAIGCHMSRDTRRISIGSPKVVLAVTQLSKEPFLRKKPFDLSTSDVEPSQRLRRTQNTQNSHSRAPFFTHMLLVDV